MTADEVNQAMRQAAEGNESFGYTEEEIVSSDIIGSHFGSIYDATQLEIVEAGGVQLVKTVAWYDNEYGFVTQLIRVLEKICPLSERRTACAVRRFCVECLRPADRPPGSAGTHSGRGGHLPRRSPTYASRRGTPASPQSSHG
ncbi:NAD-dependent glyceraldehyde-3-phosphate dehydrogenase [Klebsiella pneumoniae]|nr:NAD-dependent glyceraldehyde-3-phosphate dehydrogenase [Klebsiella pneumoniae]